MNETASLIEAAEALRRDGEPYLLATVVRVHGSAYRRPGARMLIARDRWIAGSVSGGCLEGDVTRRGWWLTEGGPRVVTYDGRGDEAIGVGLGCDGAVDVLIERAHRSAERVDPLAAIARAFHGQQRAAMATVFGGHRRAIGRRVVVDGDGDGRVTSDLDDVALRDRLAIECRAARETSEVATRSIDGAEVLVEPVRPPPRFFVLGTGHDAVPVVAAAEAVGWETIVAARHARLAVRERFARASAIAIGSEAELARVVDASDRALAVVMGHDYEADRAALAMLLETRALYVGVLGPRARTARMLDAIGATTSDPRLHAPVGLALGAETPQEIAVAIVAEALAALTRASAASLREHEGPIHERPAPAAAE